MRQRINILSLCTILVGIFLWPVIGYAEIVPDANVPNTQKPDVHIANGKIHINIAPPIIKTLDGKKVSRNSFSKFDVEESGEVIIHNDSTSQEGVADIILIKVHSDVPSLLKGTIKVAGNNARVIISNASGLTLWGCYKFLNIGRVTLTTGGLVFDKTEKFAGIRVVSDGEIKMAGSMVFSGEPLIDMLSVKQVASGLVNTGTMELGSITMIGGHKEYNVDCSVLKNFDTDGSSSSTVGISNVNKQ